MRYQITHVRKSGDEYDCSCITNVKTSTDEEFNVSEVITLIQSNHGFFVNGPSGPVDVDAVPHGNPWYIRTDGNDTPDDNLLKLPPF